MKKTSILISFFMLFCVRAGYAVDYTGMWWDSAKAGTGVFIEHVEDSSCICGAWYLYDEKGNPFWTTFWGTLSGSTLSSDLYSFTGPAFGSTWDTSQIKAVKAGEVTFNFTGSNTITMTYQVKGVSGQLNLTEFSQGACPGWLWWDPEKPGQGVAIFHYLDDQSLDKVGLAWYVYDSLGNPVWFTGTETAAEGSFDACGFSGPVLGSPWDVSRLKKQIVGSITLENIRAPGVAGGNFLNPINQMKYAIQGVSGNLTLEPFWCDSDI